MSDEAKFQPDYKGDDVPTIASRKKVNELLGLYSDYLNWNVQPEIERELRRVLCKIYGHSPYGRGATLEEWKKYSWKPYGMCYWCGGFGEVRMKAKLVL